jgi:archaellin
MKNWQITGFIAILTLGLILISGCVNPGSTSTAQESFTQTATMIPASTITTPVPITTTVPYTHTVSTTPKKVQVIGDVYGIASNPSEGITEIRFSIGLAPGVSSIDLRKMQIVFMTPFSKSDIQSLTPITLSQGDTASTTVFTSKLNGTTDVNSMNISDIVEISFKTDPLPANTIIVIQLAPGIYAEIPFSKTVPSPISKTNLLY